MCKNVFIAVLLLCCTLSTISLFIVAGCTSYWKNRAESAENLLQLVQEDEPDYYYDVLVETDAYYEWEECQ